MFYSEPMAKRSRHFNRQSGTGKTADIDWAARGARLALGAKAIGICLVLMLENREKFDDGLIETVDPAHYQAAKDLSAAACAGPENDERNEIKNFTPDRAWPLALTSAMFKHAGLTVHGNIPGTEIHIFSKQAVPPEWESRQKLLAAEMTIALRPFIEVGAARISHHLGYPKTLDPFHIFLTLETAQESGQPFDAPLSSWFPACHDQMLKNLPPSRAKTRGGPKNEYH